MKLHLIDLAMTNFCFESYSFRLNQAIDSVPLYRLAQATGISRNTLKKYRNAESSPDIRRLNLIASFTQCDLLWLLFGVSVDQESRLNIPKRQ